MMIKHLLTTTLPALVLSGCALVPSGDETGPVGSLYGSPYGTPYGNPYGNPYGTFYEATVHDSRGQPVALAELALGLADADVVVVGEYHGHQGAHLLQARLQAALHQQRPEQVLALEAFDADTQPVVDRYLKGELGEDELIHDARGWDNYRGSYRPLMEYARRHGLPVVAANAPVDLVRCVGRDGMAYIERLPQETRQTLPADPFPEIAGYRDRFLQQLGGGHGADSGAQARKLENTYLAQLLRDSTMAARVLAALQEAPGRQALVIVGRFHSEQRQGLVAILQQHAPDLDIRVLTPVMAEGVIAERDIAEGAVVEGAVAEGAVVEEVVDGKPQPDVAEGDYWYPLWPLPARYQDPQRERDHLMEQFRNRPAPDCG